jgi:hypothetical protein
MNYVKLGLTVLLAALVCGPLARPVVAADAMPDGMAASPAAAFWAGGGFKSRVAAGFVGGVWAPMTHSLDADGILVRGEYVYVNYDFNTRLSATGTGHGTLNRANAEIGYQLVRFGLASSVFVGPDYQNFSISPSTARGRGLNDKVGANFVGRVARAGVQEFPVSLEGNFSTANNTYWAKLRPGKNFGQFTVGPEIGMLGNNDFDEAHYGGFASINISSAVMLQGALGYSKQFRNNISSGNGGEGAYGEISLVILMY